MTRTETRGCTVTDYAPDDEHDDFQDNELQRFNEVANGKTLFAGASYDQTEHDAEDDQADHVDANWRLRGPKPGNATFHTLKIVKEYNNTRVGAK